MEYRVFYSWQSDSPGGLNRWFIRDAAERALKRIRQDAEIEDSPRLDSDTSAESGTPDISGTIFGKIKACDLFLGDMTLVGEIPGHGANAAKRSPNPNVLLELGYAVSCLGWDRVICVMNEAHGPARDLIFHLRNRRFPFAYTLREGGDKSPIRDALTTEIERAVLEAVSASHESVEEAMHRLSYAAIELMHEHAKDDVIPTSSPSHPIGYAVVARQDAGAERLLDAGFVKLGTKDTKYAYHWTYRGKLALKRLGLRQ